MLLRPRRPLSGDWHSHAKDYPWIIGMLTLLRPRRPLSGDWRSHTKDYPWAKAAGSGAGGRETELYFRHPGIIFRP
jgi:hypothetical protein